MAATGEKPHFSARKLAIGERAQRVFGGTAVGKMLTGSSSPAYMRLNWSSHPKLDADDYNWARELPGDPEAGRIPRNWHNAAVLGTDRSLYNSLDPSERMKDAAVFVVEGVVWIGTNPGPNDDHLFGGTIEGPPMLTVALRLGRGPLRAAMGVDLPNRPEAERLVTPNETVVLEPSIADEQIPICYPHTILG